MQDKKILGVDVSKDSLTIYNKLTTETITIENTIESISSFIKEFETTFSNTGDWKVGIESTGDYSLLPVREFGKEGFQIIYLNPIVTRKYIKGTIRGKKTDESDSVLIALAVYNGEGEIKDYKSITPDSKKVSIRTERKIKEISGDLKRYKKSLEKKKESGVENIEDIISQIDKLINLCEESSQKLLKNAIGEHRTNQEELIDSIPGFAEKLSCIVSTELGDITRFSSPKQLRAFIGLDPRISQSGDMLHMGRMTKHGNPNLRSAMYLAAKVSAKYDPHMKDIFETKIAEGKKYKLAINIVASKLCNIIFAVVTKGEPYKKPTNI